MAVTIKEVAALAGVSPSTVSRTCKNNPSISEETKERVRRAMAQLGYEPNFQASNLASQNSRAIGIILPPSEKEAFENPFYLEVIRGISQFCNQRQYINTVITGRDDREILQAIRNPLGVHTVNGIKVRTRASMGRCQGGYCEPRITALLRETLHLDATDVRLSNGASNMFTGHAKGGDGI